MLHRQSSLYEFVVNPSLPWLGASPDAIVIDSLESSGVLLEINAHAHIDCPLLRKPVVIQAFLQMCNVKVTLKHNHKHFYLKYKDKIVLAKVQWCDFNDLHI